MLVCAEKSKAVRKICFGQKSEGEVAPWIVHSLVNHLGISPEKFAQLQQVAAVFMDNFYLEQQEYLARFDSFEDKENSGMPQPSTDLSSWSSLNFNRKFRRSQAGKC